MTNPTDVIQVASFAGKLVQLVLFAEDAGIRSAASCILKMKRD